MRAEHPGAVNASPPIALASNAAFLNSPVQWQLAGSPHLLSRPLGSLGAFSLVAVTAPLGAPCAPVVLTMCVPAALGGLAWICALVAPAAWPSAAGNGVLHPLDLSEP